MWAFDYTQQDVDEKGVILFFGQRHEHGYMSQWFPSPFIDRDGNQYGTAEHWMMAEKARLFGDEAVRDKILKSNDPKAVKALGRKVRKFDENTWIQNRERIVYEGNILKFQQNPNLKTKLISTFPKVLVEASPYDRIWGIGMAANMAATTPIINWKGLNLLGKVLMSVRSSLIEQKK